MIEKRPIGMFGFVTRQQRGVARIGHFRDLERFARPPRQRFDICACTQLRVDQRAGIVGRVASSL